MAVIIGSARIDERGKATGGKAGDQTGKEVGTQNWYKHSKGWRVLRAKNPLVAQYSAEAMRSACDNSNIGYDQNQNQTLWNVAKNLGYDPGKVTTSVETDCARLVRVCVQYACIKAGLNVTIPDFYTANLASRLLSTGLFVELTGAKYTDQSAYLGAGDCIVTRTKGHTCIVLTNGPKYEGQATETVVKTYKLGDRLLKKGSSGDDVEELQTLLTQLKFLDDKIDGDFGSKTEEAVKKFQKANGITVDGEYGSKSHAAMLKVLEKEDATAVVAPTNSVAITGDSVNIRKGPGTSYGVLKAAHKGDVLEKLNTDGWLCISYSGNVCWVSKKYVNENNVCTGNSLNVRAGAGTNFASVGVVNKGTIFNVINYDGWIPVVINDVVYWVSAKYAK